MYNSLVMKDDDTRRLLNAKLTTNVTRKAALIELLYPTIYKFSCLLNLVSTIASIEPDRWRMVTGDFSDSSRTTCKSVR